MVESSTGESRRKSYQTSLSCVDPARPDGLSFCKEENEEPPTPNPLSANSQ